MSYRILSFFCLIHTNSTCFRLACTAMNGPNKVMVSVTVFSSKLMSVLRYARRDVLPLGKFTLNLSGCPHTSPYTEHLYRVIQHLVPAVSACFTDLFADRPPSVLLTKPAQTIVWQSTVSSFVNVTLLSTVLPSGHEPAEHEQHALGAAQGLRGQSAYERRPAAG